MSGRKSGDEPSVSAARDEAPIGILAGTGTVPGEVAEEIVARGGRVHIIRIDASRRDQAGSRAGFEAPAFAWGQIGGILGSLRRAGCREVLFVGSVSRPDLGKLRPDAGLLWHLPELMSLIVAGGDDGLIRKGIRFIENRGFKVVGLADVAPGLLVPSGPIGIEEPDAAGMADILFGSAVVRSLGRHDIGQAVIVSNGTIEAIEGAEGTDRMLDRVARCRVEAKLPLAGPRGVLVKRPKPGQEMRIDTPAIGPSTVERAKAAGLAGIAVLAGATLAAERAELVRRADLDGLWVYGFTEGAEHSAGLAGRHVSVNPATAAWVATPPVGGFGAAAGAADRSDACAGAAALESLANLGPYGAAVVVNGYVIGIEPGQDAAGLIKRTKHIRPWGIGRWRRRAGVAVIAHNIAEPEALVAAAREAKLAAIATMAMPGSRGAGDGELQRACADAGIAVVHLRRED